jgi:membrane protein implicated in regulation of membrane protease activity
VWEAIAQFSALAVFLLIGAIGLAFLIISYFFGEIFEMLDLGGLDVDHGDGGPGFLSLKIMSVFVTAFGGVSALGVAKEFSTLSSALFGLIGGVALAGVVYYFGRLLYSQQSSSLISSTDLVGRKAEVIVSIPAGGSGQVRCLIGESMIEKIAHARDGSAIPQHSMVLIEEVFGESVVVRPWSSIPAGTSLFTSSTEP